jgi:hypothetical protein
MSSTPNAGRAHELHCTRETAKNLRALHKRYGRTVRVNRKEYELVFCAQLAVGGEEVAGACVSQDREIYVSTAYPQIEETLIHELVHAEIHEAGFRCRIDWDPNLEEMFCELVGRSISHGFSLRRR